jgi:hypothetical protein
MTLNGWHPPDPAEPLWFTLERIAIPVRKAHDIRLMFDRAREQFEGCNITGLMAVFHLCCERRIPLPHWAQNAIRACIRAYEPRQIRRRRHNSQDDWIRWMYIEDAHHGGMSYEEAYAEAGERFGIGEEAAKKSRDRVLKSRKKPGRVPKVPK